jgi:tetratricopeptide (TPR) repeat protein
VNHFQQALTVERRPWARRQILHQLMRAFEADGRLEAAGDALVTLVELDPHAPAWTDAPLAWFPHEGFRREKANELIAHGRAADMLLGASYLLSTTDRTRAERVLRQLLTSDNEFIRSLAEAQLWRSRLLDASAEDVARWAVRIEAMPVAVRAGPYFVVAEAWQRLGETDNALLAYLRVPLQYPACRALAARSLVAAARLSVNAGHRQEATRLLRQATSEYAESPDADIARQMLNQLESPPRN